MAATRPLSTFDAYHAKSFVPGVLFFEGDVDVPRLIGALQRTAETLDVLSSQLLFSGGSVWVTRGEERDALPVEQGLLDLSLAAVGLDLRPFLPRSVPLTRFYLGLQQKMPVIAFKVTALRDGFSLGYLFNHGLLDQASMLRVLELAATYYAGRVPERVPAWVDLSAMCRDAAALALDTPEAHRAHGAQHYGIARATRPTLRFLSKALLGRNRLVQLRFDRETLRGHTAQHGVSMNTWVIGTVLQLLAAHQLRQGTPQPIAFDYPLNMRRKLGLPPDAMGNIFARVHAGLDPAALAKMSPAEAAAHVAHSAPQITPERFHDYVAWFDGLPAGAARQFFPAYVFSTRCTRIVNYDSFDHSTIAFGGRVPCMDFSWDRVDQSMPFSGVLTFDRRRGDELLLCLSLPVSCVAHAEAHGATRGLFTLS